MTQETLDLRAFLRLMRRHKIVLGIFVALGIAAGVAFTVLRPPLLSSESLVVLPPTVQGGGGAQAANAGSSDPGSALATQAVIAGSDPVLQRALPGIHPAISLPTLRGRVQVQGLTSTILSIGVEGKTVTQAEATANAVAHSYIAYVASGSIPGGQVQARILQPATTASGTSRSSRLLITGGIGALLGLLIGAITVFAFSHNDRRLRDRDEIADSIGVPVLASIRTDHPSTAPGWMKLFAEYEPGAVDAWRLRKAVQYLGVADANPNGSGPGSGFSLTVLSFAFDQGALALGPQLAVFAASRGIRTALVVGPQQDVNATATLRAACAAQPVPSRRLGQLQVIVSDHDGAVRPPDAALTVVVAVVDGQNPQVPVTMQTIATVIGVSAGAATAEQVARVAASAAAGDRDVTGILVADPDPVDPTTGRLPQLARPAHRRGATRMTGTTAETR
jgi:capsular polysaccharide biosynthesis protein